MKPFPIDLHIHSCYSDDGEFTPVELVRRCKETGIRIMAVADHNCVQACHETSLEAQKVGIINIPAIEIDCQYNFSESGNDDCNISHKLDLHLLGYGINPEESAIRSIEQNIVEQTREASHKRLHAIRQLGFSVSEDELYALSKRNYWSDSWTGELFAELLLDRKEYKKNSLLSPYREGGSRSDNPLVNFYWDFFAQGKPCYVPILYPQLSDAIQTIKASGGKAILAHPGNNLKGQFELFDKIASLGLDGVEVFSNYHDTKTMEYFFHKSQEHHLLVTCGSDYHGKTKPAVHLGIHGCFLSLEEIVPFLKGIIN